MQVLAGSFTCAGGYNFSPMTKEIQVRPFNPSAPHWVLENALGVIYRSSDLDALIRFAVGHTEQPFVSIVNTKDNIQ